MAATVLVSAGTAVADPGDPLRVLHWNIAGVTINPTDSDKPNNAGTTAVVDRLLQFTDSRHPHLVSMNEACEAQVDYAREGLVDQYGAATAHFVPSNGFDPLCASLSGGGPRSGSALIAIGADSVTDKRSYYLNDDGTITDEPRERQAACMTVSFETSLGKTVRACSLHLDPDDPIAARQGEDFVNFITEDGIDLPLVLAGDFNASPGHFASAYAPVQGGEGDFLEADHPADRETFFYAGEKLDYIFADQYHFANALSADVIDRTTCHHQIIDHPCSDHDALFGVLPFRDGNLPPDGEPPVVSAGPDASGDEGTPITLTGSVSDDNPATTAEWTVEPQTADPGATCSFARPRSPRTTVNCTDDGTFVVTLTAADGDHPRVSDSAIVTVSNAPPRVTITRPTDWQVFRADTPVSLASSIADAANDTHTCSVDWDDPTEPEEEFPPTAGDTCNRTHVFDDAGMYTITVTATDDDGAEGKAQVMVVVYDPAAGRVNADGSLEARAGAYVPNRDIAREEWFHLDARYTQQTGSEATGPARTWMGGPAPRFEFDSYGLDWLVVTPDGKFAARGTGTVAYAAEQFGFVFYGHDGCDNGGSRNCRPGPDRFRAVVWPLSASDNPAGDIWYDNGLGAVYDVDRFEMQTVKSGQVLIQP